MTQIPLNDELEEMLAYAMRYCLPRASYAPASFIWYMAPLLPQMSEGWLRLCLRDLDEALRPLNEPAGPFGSPPLPDLRERWKQFRGAIEEELERREHHE